MDMYKECAFTRRLVSFNHTLVPAGSTLESRPTIANMRHEAIAGRTAVEMASSVLMFSQSPHLEDGNSLVLWLDNFEYQNKSYVLFEALLSAIHCRLVPFQEVVLKYSVAGHSFMTADSFHARIEEEMKKEAILKIKELQNCVRVAGKLKCT